MADFQDTCVLISPTAPTADESVASCSGRLVYDIPTRLECIEPAVRFACGHLTLHHICSEERAARIGLALHEALTNAMIHGNLGLSSELKEQPDNAFGRALAARCADPALCGRHVIMTLSFNVDGCDISVADEGNGFDYTSLAGDETNLQAGDDSALMCSGRGILIMRAFSDALRFSRDGRCVILSFTNQNHPGKRPANRRGNRRLPYSVRVEIRRAGLTSSEAFSRDISADGMALISPVQIPLGPINLLLPAFEGRASAPVSARVVRCQRMTDAVFDVGCEFADSGGLHEFTISG